MRKNQTEQYREVLEALIPAILKIDGGCPYCIESFIEDVNGLLETKHIPFRYLADYVDSNVYGLLNKEIRKVEVSDN